MQALVVSLIFSAPAGYLLGSINTAILVVRALKHEDIRSHGSGNAGVTNVYRMFGRTTALCTILGDFVKAALAVLLARNLFAALGAVPSFDPGYPAGLFVLLGHIYPVYFAFKGGKGGMPLIGILALVNLPLLGILAAIGLIVVLISRKMSLGSVVCSLVMPLAGFFLARAQQENALLITGFLGAYAMLVLISHRSNIKRLLSGTENPLSNKSP